MNHLQYYRYYEVLSDDLGECGDCGCQLTEGNCSFDYTDENDNPLCIECAEEPEEG